MLVGTEVMTTELEVVAYAPVADALLLADDDPTGRRDQLNITQAQTKAVIEPPACWMISGEKRNHDTGSKTSSCRAGCHGLAAAANLTLPWSLFSVTESNSSGTMRRNISARNRSATPLTISQPSCDGWMRRFP
jgi:hypothetical protein